MRVAEGQDDEALHRLRAVDPSIAARLAEDPQLAEEVRGQSAAPPELGRANRQMQIEFQERKLKYREWLLNTQYAVSTSFDKTLVTLATGALALSVALLTAIDKPPPEWMWWLALAWKLLVGCVISLML